MQLFKLLNFKKELDKQSRLLTLKIEKIPANYKTVKDIN